METVTGCVHLQYDETQFIETTKMARLGSDKVVWERQSPNGLQLCQFCDQVGRLNDPESCITKAKAKCPNYVEHTHTLIFRSN